MTTPADKSPREHLHISVNARAARKNYALLMSLMAEAVKNAPVNVTFTSPDIIKLQSRLEKCEGLLKDAMISMQLTWPLESERIQKYFAEVERE